MDCKLAVNGQTLSKAFVPLPAGGTAFKTPVGTFYPPNLTPDPETGIGKWTDAQIKTLLRKGTRPDGTKVAPIMPTGFYEILTDKDVDAIVAYLRTVTPVKNATPAPVYKMAFERDISPGADKPMAEADLTDSLISLGMTP